MCSEGGCPLLSGSDLGDSDPAKKGAKPEGVLDAEGKPLPTRTKIASLRTLLPRGHNPI